ncbi:hypothetical protein ACFFLS_22105 [Flavobacterium procerum]|uniref:GLPGLI family protein n=1 Tax=Flavobacterium procerum TaxID=1455569 RepID=A0ABV6BYI9_9FLAO
MTSNQYFLRIFILFLFSTIVSNAQIGEGHRFCDELKTGSYFPLSYEFKKKILWSKTYYWETKIGTKQIEGKEYAEIKQEWEDKNTSILYMREEDGVVYQYDQYIKKEIIRFDQKQKKGDAWTTANKAKYKIISYEGELQTPYCKYTNLLVIEAEVSYGKFNFYYLKGQGYIGATTKGMLISCLTPEWN